MQPTHVKRQAMRINIAVYFGGRRGNSGVPDCDANGADFEVLHCPLQVNPRFIGAGSALDQLLEWLEAVPKDTARGGEEGGGVR